jgi:hypothetical protein
MKLEKRDCGIEMKLVPYGAGWTDVYLNIGGDNLYFIITSVYGDQFSELLNSLYHLYPEQDDPEHNERVDFWNGLCERVDGKYEVVEIVEKIKDVPAVVRDIPYKAEFCWDEEGASSQWTLTRKPTLETDFEMQIDISVNRSEAKKYSYKVRYKDFCYAVAKACTQTLKSHGIYGYHYSVYYNDINLRHLLFIKSVALDNFEARSLTFNDRGNGESSCFEKELELLLFDM